MSALDEAKANLAAAEAELEKLQSGRESQRRKVRELQDRLADLDEQNIGDLVADAIGDAHAPERTDWVTEARENLQTAERVEREIDRLIREAEKKVSAAERLRASALAAMARELEPALKARVIAAAQAFAAAQAEWLAVAEAAQVQCTGAYVRHGEALDNAMIAAGLDPVSHGRLGSGFTGRPADEHTLRAIAART